ncbi:MAG: Adenylate cyclase [Myxococcaceae bacterium]|nr:Adenylate cyclase [Myxococcaceae bacterium]
MRQEKSVTVTQIHLEQSRAEEQVMAQSALIGERAVAWTRLTMVLLIGLATALVSRLTGAPLVDDPVRMAMVGSYLSFSLFTLFITHRVKQGTPRRAMWIPLSFIFIDAGFFVGQTWIAQRLGEPSRPEIVVATYSLLVCFSVARVRTLHAITSTVVSIGSIAGIAWLQGWADPVWTTFVCSCVLALGMLITFTNRRTRAMFVDVRRRENLSRFLPPQLVEKVLKGGGANLVPVQREVTVLFSDIRSFTSMSESMPPKAVLEFLDGYFGHMGQIVRGHEGMLNKFLGDGLLAVWGVPDHQEDHAERALKAAVDMRRKMVEINADRAKLGIAAFKIGIGVHTGVVAAGMLGGADQREYTVIGDAVNLASRIEGLTKVVGTDILASESAWKQGGGRFEGERVGEEHVKGRDAGVVVYAVRGSATA